MRKVVLLLVALFIVIAAITALGSSPTKTAAPGGQLATAPDPYLRISGSYVPTATVELPTKSPYAEGWVPAGLSDPIGLPTVDGIQGYRSWATTYLLPTILGHQVTADDVVCGVIHAPYKVDQLSFTEWDAEGPWSPNPFGMASSFADAMSKPSPPADPGEAAKQAKIDADNKAKIKQDEVDRATQLLRWLLVSTGCLKV